MAIASLEIWQRLVEPAQAELVADAARVVATGTVVADVSRLRARWDAALVAAALELAKARRKAAAKFGDEVAAEIVADVAGVEMATSSLAGAYKAARFVRCLGAHTRVVDLCCGIGGELMAMCVAGIDAVGVDLDPVRAWMAGRNAHAETRCADVLDETLPVGAFHLDPARRHEDRVAGGRRLYRYEDLQPGPAVIERLITERRDGGIKLGPGVDFASLPMHVGEAELELISEDGRLTQAVLWAGRLAEPNAQSRQRTATALRSDGESFTVRGVPQKDAGEHGVRASPPYAASRFLFEPDPAAERARLLGVLCERFGVREFCPGLGLLTAETNPCESSEEARAWLGSGRKGFEVIAQMPWREHKVIAWLKERGYAVDEVKTRGKAVLPDEVLRHLSRELKSPPIVGEEQTTALFVLRFGRQLEVLVTRRIWE